MNLTLRKLLSLAVCLLPAGAAAGMPAAGDPFPAWSLQDHRGQTVSSAQLAGSTYVLWFYPKAMTPGCTVEGNAFRDRAPSFEDKGVKIFGISFDPPKDNAAFVEAQGFPFPLLSDEKRALGEAVGAATANQDYARRISFLIGADGIVLQSYESVEPTGHADEVLRDIDAAAGATKR